MRMDFGFDPVMNRQAIAGDCAFIQLAYRKVIDVHSTVTWERELFADTYREFCMQAQYYDQTGGLETLADLVSAYPRAEKLHGLVSTAAIGYLRKLKQTLPEPLDQTGKPWIPFSQFQFAIVRSHRQRIDEHCVAITFYSEELLWLASHGDRLLLTTKDQLEPWLAGEKIQPGTVLLNSSLLIHTIQRISYDRHTTANPDFLS